MWDAGRSARLRYELVEQLKAEGAIRSRQVEEAFLVVPREHFLPDSPLDQVYQDTAIVVKRVRGEPRSSSSQPALMADMLEVLELSPGMRVLEIGAGTGYNAALLARLVGRADRVVSVDIDPDMASAARANLARAGFSALRVVQSDGAAGYPLLAPYDRIVVTVQQYDLSPGWIEQLGRAGILLVPLTVHQPLRLSLIPAFRKEGRLLVAANGSLGGFMPMQGAMAHPRLAEPSLTLTPGAAEQALVLVSDSSPARAFFQRAGDGRVRSEELSPTSRQAAETPESLQHQGAVALLLALEMGERAFRLYSGDRRFGFKGYAVGVVGGSGRGATVIGLGELLHYGEREAAAEVLGVLERWRSLDRPLQRDFPVIAAPSDATRLPERSGWLVERPNYSFLIGVP